jgi:dipeptidyl aminopeptidase/acylaminoacyl peptidase
MTHRRNYLKSILLVTCACVSALVFHVADAQERDVLPVEDILREHSFGGSGWSTIDLSPDGKWVAYIVEDAGKAESHDREAAIRTGVPFGTTGEDIYVLNTEAGTARSLTEGKSENWLLKWSPNGRYLAFLTDRDGSGQAKLWVWDRTTNDLKKVFDAPARTDQIEWLPDSHNIIIRVVPEGMSIEAYVSKIRSNADADKPVNRTQDSTVLLYQSKHLGQSDMGIPASDPWNLNYSTLGDLAMVDVASGRTSIIVHGQRIAKYSLSSDGSRVAYTIPKRFEKPGSQQVLFDLATVVIKTTHQDILATDIRLDYDGAEFSWSPDSTTIAYHTGGMEAKAKDCYVVRIDGRVSRRITQFSPPAETPRLKSSVPLWDAQGNVYLLKEGALWRASPDRNEAVKVAEVPNRQIDALIPQSGNLLWRSSDEHATVVVTHDDGGKQDGFFKVDLVSGASNKLLEQSQCYTCADRLPQVTTTPDGRHIAYFAEDAQHESDLWLNDATFDNARRLTHLNPQFDKYKMGAARLIDWMSDDGDRLQGALLLPSDYQQGTRYPLIVLVYGGSFLSNHFDHFGLAASHGPFNLQLLATRGYAVLLPDAPQHLGSPMADLGKTVLPAVNKAIEIGIADPDRVGIMGHSYGGYSTMALIVQSKRFKAAVEVDGMGDLIDAYGQMSKDGTAYETASSEMGQGKMGGSPWQFRERYIENSPSSYLDRIETPLLIVHGADDTVVASFLGDELFVSLRRLGKEVEYAKYEGEEHSPLNWSYANQLDFCNRMIAWFGRYLKASRD